MHFKNCLKLTPKAIQSFALLTLVLLLIIGAAGVFAFSNCINSKEVSVHKVSLSGHDYLFLSNGNLGQSGVVHDPDCDCHKNSGKSQSPANTKKAEGARYLIMPTVKETVPATQRGN